MGEGTARALPASVLPNVVGALLLVHYRIAAALVARLVLCLVLVEGSSSASFSSCSTAASSSLEVGLLREPPQRRIAQLGQVKATHCAYRNSGQ